MYLQLADNQSVRSSIPQQKFYNMMGQNQTKENPYLWVPSGLIPGYDNVWINEKEFDDLDEIEWHTIMSLLEAHQPEANNMGFFPFSTKKGRTRRADRRTIRNTRKVEKIKLRGETGTGIGSVIKSAVQMFTPSPVDVQPFYDEVYVPPGDVVTVAPGAVAATPPSLEPPKTWMQKNWGYLAGGAAVLAVGGILLAKKR